MFVSVVDQTGAPVSGLGPSDFIVREDNVAREVVKVAPADDPMQIAVLVDTSRAARNNLSYYRSALPPFLTALTNPTESGRKNQVALIATGERPTVITNYTSNLSELLKGVNRLWSLDDSGAYLLDAVIETSQEQKKRETTRPVIVAITQEGPELSYRNYDQALDALASGGAAFHALIIGQPAASLTEEARSRNIVLDRGPKMTGGFREQLLTPLALDSRLKVLAQQLTHQYLVTFAHPESLIPPERVTVAARQPGMEAHGTLVKDRFQQDRR